MEATPKEIQAFRYWIQGYGNFYEPMVIEYFRVAGYRLVRRPATVGQADIQRIIDALFDGRRRLGPEVDSRTMIRHLERRHRLQPDCLLERGGQHYLAEFKSWGGFGTGLFDLATLEREFIRQPGRGAFFLVDWLEGVPVAGKCLVVSSRSAEHEQVLARLRQAYQTEVELLYLDEILRAPQLAGAIDRQLRYLDAAVAELRQALGGPAVAGARPWRDAAATKGGE
jgi:hypothetical protein